MFTFESVLLISPHLTVGEIFRLRRALGKEWQQKALWQIDALLSERLGYKRVRTMDSIFTIIAQTARCSECGLRCRMQPSVCESCRSQEQGYFAMVNKQYVSNRYKTVKHLSHRGLRTALQKVKVVRKGRLGQHMLWRHEVDAVFQAFLNETNQGSTQTNSP